MAGGVFISYRRGVDSHAAGRLHDSLASRLGRKRVFIDVDDIEVGEDFVARLDGQLARSQAVIVVIGPGWHTAFARLADPEDFVRREIAAALARPEIRVIPVFVDGAPTPVAETLPSEIVDLAARNGFAFDHADFAIVADRIARDLGARRRRVLRSTGAIGGIAILALGGWVGTGIVSDRQAVADCDRLAAHPDDPNRIGSGVAMEEMDGAAATAACAAAFAADPENTRLLYQLGRAHHRTERGAAAADAYRRVLDRDPEHAGAMFGLGQLHSQGLGMANDDVAARRWFKAAAQHGNPWGMAEYGRALAFGIGGPADPVTAAPWLRAAADAGNSAGMLGLARLLYRGEGVAFDPVESARLMMAALATGDAWPRTYVRGFSYSFGAETRREIRRLLTEAGVYEGPLGDRPASEFPAGRVEFGLAVQSAIDSYATGARPGD